MPSMTHDSAGSPVVGQVDGLVVPRFAGHSTFARLPRIEDVPRYDVAIAGVPFDTGVTYRPGARFGPAHIRQSSRLLRPYNPALDVAPFADSQVVDAGDVVFNPFDITTAVRQIEQQAYELIRDGAALIALGGDHTIAYPLLKAMNRAHGPVALVHFDAHLDTWDTYFDTPLTHGTPFRRAAEDGPLRSGAQRARRHPRIAVLTARPGVRRRTRIPHRALPRVRATAHRRHHRARCGRPSPIRRCTSPSTSTSLIPHMRQAPEHPRPAA